MAATRLCLQAFSGYNSTLNYSLAVVFREQHAKLVR